MSDVPLDSSNGEWIIVCSENTFTALTGITDYKIIEVQASMDIAGQIRNLITPDMKLLDMRQHNEEVRTGYFGRAGALMSAKAYRDKKALPLVEKLKEVVKNLTIKCVQLTEQGKKLTAKVDGQQKLG